MSTNPAFAGSTPKARAARKQLPAVDVVMDQTRTPPNATRGLRGLFVLVLARVQVGVLRATADEALCRLDVVPA